MLPPKQKKCKYLNSKGVGIIIPGFLMHFLRTVSICHFISTIRKKTDMGFDTHVSVTILEHWTVEANRNAIKTMVIWITSFCSLSLQWIVPNFSTYSFLYILHLKIQIHSPSGQEIKARTWLIQSADWCHVNFASVNCSEFHFM